MSAADRRADSEVKAFPTAGAWERWLAARHATAEGVWLQLFKKHSGKKCVGHAKALEIALCYGWIDGQIKKHDGESWLRKFTPRRPKSIWSKRNQTIVAQMIAAGKMQPAGLKEISAAKADGRWEKAYDSPKQMTAPDDFLKQLAKHKKAFEFYKTLSKANCYAISWRLQTAKKPETRDRRMKMILDMLIKGETFH